MDVEKQDLGRLPRLAKLYVSAISVCGFFIMARCAVVHQAFHSQFFFYLACAILCSKFKVFLPGITGTLSASFIFVLASAADLNLAETVAIGVVSGVTQLFIAARKRPRHIQVVFTIASQAVASTLAYQTYLLPVGQSMALRLFWTSIVYFLANSWAVAIILALTEGKRSYRVWRVNLLWTAPHYVVGGGLAGLLHYWNQVAGWHTAVLVLPAVYLVHHSYQLYLARVSEEQRHVGEIADLHLRTIQALALAIDARDGTTHGHLRRVQVYARELGRELGLPEDERQALDAAALLHDIGKLAVPEHIISKPGKLTPEEFEIMKVHPVIGAEILESVHFPYPVAPIVLAHHERWDGSGYPNGLRGEQIPIGARIVAAVDCLDALASDRQYRRALPLDEAMQRVRAESGRSFDPRVVDVLQRRYRELEGLARKETGEKSPLSTEIRVGPGVGPAAGFELSQRATVHTRPGFITSIADARQEFQILLELTQELGSSLKINETLALLASRLKAVIPYDGIAIYTVEGEHLVTQYASGDDSALFSSLEIPLGEGISGWVTQNNKPMINGNPSVEPGYLGDPKRFSVHRSAVSVPLSGLQGVIGALTLYHHEKDAFTKDHLRILLAVSSKAGLTIENSLHFEQTDEKATTDGLTGLPNARSLLIRLDEAVGQAGRDQSRLAVLVIDMDGFKQVNDRFGHSAGDLVLKSTADILRRICSEQDYAARMGGDEFVVLIQGAVAANIDGRVRQLNDLLAQTCRQLYGADFLSASAGVAWYPEDGADAEEVLARADARMYETKRRHYSALAQLSGAVESFSVPTRPLVQGNMRRKAMQPVKFG